MQAKNITPYLFAVNKKKRQPFSFFRANKIKDVLTYSVLTDDIKRHLYSFFTTDMLVVISVVDKKSNKICAERFKVLLLQEYRIKLPINFDSQMAYFHLKKEHNLFIAYSHSIYLEENTFNWTFKTHLQWVCCVLESDSFNFFLSAVNKSCKKFEAKSAKKAIILRDNQIEFHTNFYLLLTHPFLFEFEELMTQLIYLCRIDAFYTLKLLFNMHPQLDVCMTFLLKEAISCLNIQTVNTLLELGANLHQFISYSVHRDYDFKLFCSPLFLAMMLPEESSCSLNQDGYLCHWDNQKLVNLIVFLIAKGSDPRQNCIFTEIEALDLESAQKKEDKGVNCVTMAQEILDNPIHYSCLNWAYLELIKNMVDLKKQREPSHEEIVREHRSNSCVIS